MAIPEALEVAISADMTPFHLNVGVSRGFISAKLRGAVKDHLLTMWPFAPMCTGPTWVLSWFVLPAHSLSLIWMPTGYTKKDSYLRVSQLTLINIHVIISTIALLG